MGLRSSGFERRPMDFYPTPLKVARVLAQHLPPGTRFIEPCAGDGALVRHLQSAGHICTEARDIEPRDPLIDVGDGADIGPGEDMIITNPPFGRDMLLPLLSAWLGAGRTCWVLLPIRIICNRYFGPYAPHVRTLLPTMRPKWIEGTKHQGKDDVAWVHLTPAHCDFLLPRSEVRS